MHDSIILIMQRSPIVETIKPFYVPKVQLLAVKPPWFCFLSILPPPYFFSLYPYICHQQFLHYPSILSQFNPFSLFLDNKITGEFSAFPRVRRCCLFPRCPAAQLCLWDSALCLAARALSLQLQKKSMPLGHGILPSTVGKLTGNG